MAVKEWYVIFSPNTNKLPWWQKLAIRKHDPIFGHVSLLQCVTEHHALFIDPSPEYLRLDLRELEIPVSQKVKQMGKGQVILHYICDEDKDKNWTFYIPTCVSQIKYALGLNSKALTPFALCNDLINRGASVVR